MEFGDYKLLNMIVVDVLVEKLLFGKMIVKFRVTYRKKFKNYRSFDAIFL